VLPGSGDLTIAVDQQHVQNGVDMTACRELGLRVRLKNRGARVTFVFPDNDNGLAPSVLVLTTAIAEAPANISIRQLVSASAMALNDGSAWWGAHD
jgi:hypothetical protein